MKVKSKNSNNMGSTFYALESEATHKKYLSVRIEGERTV